MGQLSAQGEVSTDAQRQQFVLVGILWNNKQKPIVWTLNGTHVLLIQVHEPPLLPQHVEAVVNAIVLDQAGAAWNATGPILTDDDLERPSVVKTVVGGDSRILACSGRNSSVHGVEGQGYVRKVLGLIAYLAETLRELVTLPPSVIERHEHIKQMRLIENGYLPRSVPVDQSTTSVNEPEDLLEVLAVLEQSEEQQSLLEAALRRSNVRGVGLLNILARATLI